MKEYALEVDGFIWWVTEQRMELTGERIAPFGYVPTREEAEKQLKLWVQLADGSQLEHRNPTIIERETATEAAR